jgi:BRCT domain type II-containing protein
MVSGVFGAILPKVSRGDAENAAKRLLSDVAVVASLRETVGG